MDPSFRLIWLEVLVVVESRLMTSTQSLSCGLSEVQLFVFPWSFFRSGCLGRYTEVLLEPCSSGFFCLAFKPLERKMFELDWQRSWYLDLSLLHTFISASLRLYGMESEPPVFLLKSASKVIFNESWNRCETDKVKGLQKKFMYKGKPIYIASNSAYCIRGGLIQM